MKTYNCKIFTRTNELICEWTMDAIDFDEPESLAISIMEHGQKAVIGEVK